MCNRITFNFLFSVGSNMENARKENAGFANRLCCVLVCAACTSHQMCNTMQILHTPKKVLILGLT